MAFLSVLPAGQQSFLLEENGTDFLLEEDNSSLFILEAGSDICPQIEVMFDYTTDPLTAGPLQVWTDITPYVVSYSRQPVRTNELDQPSPATATLTLRNDDGRFTPDNASGPYFGGLLPYRRVRVRALWASVVYSRFFGYIEDWPQSWDSAGKDRYVTLNLVDNLVPLETFDLQGQSFASKVSGSAIRDVLNGAGVPLGTLDAGNSTIVASGTLSTGSFASQRIRDIAASENGVVFADGAGNVQFHDRHRRVTGGASVNVQATIGDGGGSEIPYVNPRPLFGDVWPIVNVTPNGGTVQTNQASTRYFKQTLNWPTGGTYLVSSSSEALNAAQYLSYRYSSPETRVTSVELIGAAAPSLWPSILTLDTSSRVNFIRRVPGGSTVTLAQFVEGYGETVQIGQDWRVQVPLSPADTQTYWVLGDPIYGLLGQTTRLAY